MNSTPPHFTWRPKLSKATCQSLSAHASGALEDVPWAFGDGQLLVLVEPAWARAQNLRHSKTHCPTVRRVVLGTELAYSPCRSFSPYAGLGLGKGVTCEMCKATFEVQP